MDHSESIAVEPEYDTCCGTVSVASAFGTRDFDESNRFGGDGTTSIKPKVIHGQSRSQFFDDIRNHFN
ncbi:hypothetical protein RP20_CCG022115 [Aedes albopictus]|nr:hypothetical protein RP20_CCG022115 [Aedes albopictus]